MNLSQENIDKLVFGGIYQIDDEDLEKWCPNQLERLNDQHYGIWVPVHSISKEGEENYYMIDTYQISTDCYNNKYSYEKEKVWDGLIQGLEEMKEPERGRWVANKPCDYFYSAIIKVTNENIDIFHLVADLHDYRLSDEKEIREYNEEDVIRRLRLYNEHCYSVGGVCAVRKNAKLNYENKINAKISDIQRWIDYPRPANDYEIGELLKIEQEANEKGANYDKDKLDKFVEFNKFLKHLQALADQYHQLLYDIK